MIMLALRDIDQEKVDYFQQGHTHLQTIHATLDPGVDRALYWILKHSKLVMQNLI
jgi:hypothetical protein